MTRHQRECFPRGEQNAIEGSRKALRWKGHVWAEMLDGGISALSWRQVSRKSIWLSEPIGMEPWEVKETVIWWWGAGG